MPPVHTRMSTDQWAEAFKKVCLPEPSVAREVWGRVGKLPLAWDTSTARTQTRLGARGGRAAAPLGRDVARAGGGR